MEDCPNNQKILVNALLYDKNFCTSKQQHITNLYNKMNIKSILLGVGVMFLAFASYAETKTFKAHPDEKLFDACTLKVNGKPVDVYQCRVSKYPFNQVWPGYQRPIEQTELAGFAYWETDGVSKIEISAEEVAKVVVRPLSLGIKPTMTGNKIKFKLDKIKPVAVELGNSHTMIHLFPNPIQKSPVEKKVKNFCCPQCSFCSPVVNEIPKEFDKNFYYFPAGVHHVGTLMLKSNDTVYIEGGAVVYGSLVADNADNIKIYGRGILDTANIVRANRWARGGFGNLHFRNCTNLKIEGIVLRDPNSWGVNIRRCKNVELSNLKFIGYWRYNSDGIDLWDSENIVMKDCFIRAYDDSIIVRSSILPNRNIKVSNCVLWNDWGISLAVEADKPVKIVEDIHFENIDIIRASSNAMLIRNASGCKINNITFKNVNVELPAWHGAQIHQKPDEPEALYKPDYKSDYTPRLINLRIGAHSSKTKIPEQSMIDGIVFENISLYGNENAPLLFHSLDEQRRIGTVLIKNLRYNGKPITDLKQTKLKANETTLKLMDKVKIEK